MARESNDIDLDVVFMQRKGGTVMANAQGPGRERTA